jgi:UDP-N-acetylmuramoyl-L-alanyl-D-glutamate--2,6-diaminopimelate ligase
MRLQSLLKQVDVLSISGPLDREVDAVSEDSRSVGEGGVFVAIRGEAVDGHKFASSVKCGVVVGEQPTSVADGVTFVLVSCSRSALAQIASNLYGNPSSKMSVVGLTGTNGKTTTSWILEAILVEAGRKVGVVGTTGNRIAGVELETVYTTPPAPIWQGLLSEMLAAECDSVVAEVSSIALSSKRVAADKRPGHALARGEWRSGIPIWRPSSFPSLGLAGCRSVSHAAQRSVQSMSTPKQFHAGFRRGSFSNAERR